MTGEMILRAVSVLLGIKVDENSMEQANAAVEKVKKHAMSSMDTIKTYWSKGLKMLGVGFSFAGIKSLVSVAEAAKQKGLRFNRIFQNADTGKSFAKQAAANLNKVAQETDIAAGRIKADYMNIAVFAKTAGMGVKESSEFSAEAMKACADASAFLNKDFSSTVYLMKALMRGNLMLAKRVGLNITAQQQEELAVQKYNAAFEELNEAQKKWVMLNLFEKAIKDAGGFGAAADKANTFSNQMENLNANIAVLKVNLGSPFMQLFVWGAELANWAVKKLNDAVVLITDNESLFGATTKLIGNAFKALEPQLKKVSAAFTRFKKALTPSQLKLITRLLSILLSVLAGLMIFKSVAGAVRMFVTALGLLSKALLGVSKAGGLMFIALTIIALIIEDIVVFMMGGKSLIGRFFNHIGIGSDNARKAIVKFVKGAIEWLSQLIGHIAEAFETSNSFFGGLGTLIAEFIKWLLGVVTSLLKSLLEWALGMLKNMWNAIVAKVGEIKQSIIDGFSAAMEYVASLPGKALEWGADFIDSFIDGVKNGLPSLSDTVDSMVEAIAKKLHFSKPDEGPLRDADQWMPDMIDLMVDGINANRDKLASAVRAMAGDMNILVQGASANAATAAISHVSNRSTVINQRVDISNSYQGGSMDMQRNASKAMNKSADDATAAMARGLAYSV